MHQTPYTQVDNVSDKGDQENEAGHEEQNCVTITVSTDNLTQ